MSELATELLLLPEITFDPGSDIITEGETAAGLFFLTSGTVTVTKEGVEIHQINIPGAIFGEMSYLLDCMPTATVTAVTRCTMRLVRDREGFILQNPKTALYIARILAGRLDSVVRYLVDLKSQFPDHGDHFGLVNEILDTIINKHPRRIEKDLGERDLVDD